MTPIIEHAGIEGTRPRVIVDGLPVRLAPGQRVDVSDDAAREHLAAGTVKLVEGKKRSKPEEAVETPAPTGDEQGGDKGEAGGTDAAEPPAEVEPFDGDTSELDKDQLITELEKRSIDFDHRFGEKRLRGLLDAALKR